MSLFLVVALLVDILNSRNGCCLLKKGVMDMKLVISRWMSGGSRMSEVGSRSTLLRRKWSSSEGGTERTTIEEDYIHWMRTPRRLGRRCGEYRGEVK
jgi:hypothetical protein